MVWKISRAGWCCKGGVKQSMLQGECQNNTIPKYRNTLHIQIVLITSTWTKNERWSSEVGVEHLAQCCNQVHIVDTYNLSHTLWHVLLVAIPSISRAHAALWGRTSTSGVARLCIFSKETLRALVSALEQLLWTCLWHIGKQCQVHPRP